MEFKHKFRLSPLNDGISHINCYTKGKTQLGRALSHFAPIGFKHYEWGTFGSIEAAWYWLSSGKQHDHLKPLHGFKAKEAGKLLSVVKYDGFMNDIEEAVRLKITQNEKLLEDFKASVLPFTHYYAYGSGMDSVAVDNTTRAWFEWYYPKLRNKECGRFQDIGERIGIVGSRSINDYEFLCDSIIDLDLNILEIVSGGAAGVDRLAARFAKERNIPLKEFIPDWEAEPKRAGFIRNENIIERSDSVIALWDGISKGTKHSIELAKKQGKTLYILKPPVGNLHA